MNEILVSVVTPFHNTARYLAQCIESVLGQSYAHFEYILVDNCSTDGSGDIAENYAKRDSRIRVIHRTELLSQVQNYNGALAEISAESKYCKIVQADDYIFGDCLRLMVQAFAQSESIGLVSAYDLKANIVRGSGFPYRKGPWPGREAGQTYLRSGVFVFGSPTTVMYRSSLIRQPKPFFDEGLLHEDTEKCFEILKEWDFAFVYQVLSFLRTENESISSAVRSFDPDTLDRYILVHKYSPVFLPENEAAVLKEQTKREYYAFLARATLRSQSPEFWKYHRAGLKTIEQEISRPYLAGQVIKRVARMVFNPGTTIAKAMGRRRSPAQDPSGETKQSLRAASTP